MDNSITDLDLDIINLIKKHPKGDSAIYMHGNVFWNINNNSFDLKSGHAYIDGSEKDLSALSACLLDKNDGAFKRVFFQAVGEYIANKVVVDNKKDEIITHFLEFMNKIIQHKPINK